MRQARDHTCFFFLSLSERCKCLMSMHSWRDRFSRPALQILFFYFRSSSRWCAESLQPRRSAVIHKKMRVWLMVWLTDEEETRGLWACCKEWKKNTVSTIRLISAWEAKIQHILLGKIAWQRDLFFLIFNFKFNWEGLSALSSISMRFTPVSKNLSKLLDLKSIKQMDKIAQYNPSPLTMQQFVDFGKTPSEAESYKFLKTELPIRLANTMKEINLLPSSLLQMPSIMMLQVSTCHVKKLIKLAKNTL